MTIDEVFNRLTEETVYARYLGNTKLKTYYNVPWRSDTNKSLVLFHHKDLTRILRLWWRDTAYGESGDVVNLIQKVHNLSFQEALHKINDEFNLNKTVNRPTVENIEKLKPCETPVLSYKANEYRGKHVYTKTDIKYWSKYGITKDMLKKEHIYSVNKLYLNNKHIWTYHKNNPIYLYLYKHEGQLYYKFYRPLERDRRRKWLSTLTGQSDVILDGLRTLREDDHLVITKSRKDRICLNMMGINSIAVQSENTGIDRELWTKILNKVQTENIYNLWDNDKAGIELSEKFAKEYGTTPIFMDIKDGKDVSDCIENTNINHIKNYIYDKLGKDWIHRKV